MKTGRLRARRTNRTNDPSLIDWNLHLPWSSGLSMTNEKL
jgi:hypothetical protein